MQLPRTTFPRPDGAAARAEGAVHDDLAAARDDVLLDPVTPRRRLGVAAEIDPAAVVDDQVPARDRELGIRREGDPVATRVPVDDVADDPRPGRDRGEHTGAVLPGRRAVAVMQHVALDHGGPSVLEHDARAARLLQAARPDPGARQRGRVPAQDHRAGDIQRDGAVRGGQLEVRKGQVPRRLRRLDPVREDGARSTRPAGDRDAALGRLAARGDRLSLAEGRARDQTARLPGRERLREPVQRLQRARLRPRVRVRAARRRPEVAAHRDRASSGDPDKHARDDDRRYDRCTPQHGRECSRAARLR